MEVGAVATGILDSRAAFNQKRGDFHTNPRPTMPAGLVVRTSTSFAYTATHGPAQNALRVPARLGSLLIPRVVRVAIIIVFRDLHELRGVVFTLTLRIERSVNLP